MRHSCTSASNASAVVRLLQDRHGDEKLRERFRREGHVDAPTLLDAEVTSAVRGLLLTSKLTIKVSDAHAAEMLDDFADLRIVRHPTQPHQRRALALRNNFTAYDALYVALAETLEAPLLTDDQKYAGAAGHSAHIEDCP